MAPRAERSKRTVVGTLLAERLLDVAVLLVIFVVVGYGLLGEVGGNSVELIAIVAIVGVAAAGVGWRFVRRNEKLHGLLAPIASATLGLRRAHHGLLLLGMTLVIWAIEAGVWMSVGAAVGFEMDPIEGLYLVALASVFSLIPSGPGYAGTQDAAVTIGIKALGGTGGDRGRLPADAALRDRRADHDPGSDPARRPATAGCQEPARRARRGQELTVTDTASLTNTTTETTAAQAPPHARGVVRRPGRARARALGRADRRRAGRARDRARRARVPPRREPGRVLLLPVPAERRLRVQPAAARPAALLPDRR